MKRYILVFLFIIGGLSVQSQVLISLILGDKLNSDKIEFGLQGGGNFSSIFNMDTKKYVSDWNLGFYFVIKIKDNWYTSTGVLVKAKLGSGKLTEKDLDVLGVNFPDSCTSDNGKYYQKLNTFIVPMMIRYKFPNRFFTEFGFQASLRYKSWVEYTSKTKEHKVDLRQYNKDLTNVFDIGATAGVGYRFSDKRTAISLNFRYYYGFVNAFKGMPGTKNNSFFLEANIPIGAGEKAQKKREEAARKKAEKKQLKQQEKNE